jgi:hypothetical protein
VRCSYRIVVYNSPPEANDHYKRNNRNDEGQKKSEVYDLIRQLDKRDLSLLRLWERQCRLDVL